jgi:hypothetical protein
MSKNRSIKQRVASIPKLTRLFATASGAANRRKRPITLAHLKALEKKEKDNDNHKGMS